MFGNDFLIAPVLDPIYEESTIPFHSIIFPNSNSNNNLRKGRSKHQSSSSFGEMKVGYVDVYIPSNTSWTHLWTGETINNLVSSDVTTCDDTIAGCVGIYVRVDAPIGCPPVFYLPNSIIGQSLRNYIIESNWDAISGTGEESFESLENYENNTIIEFVDVNTYTTTTTADRALNDFNSDKPIIQPFRYELKERDWYEWLGISQFATTWNHTNHEIDVRAYIVDVNK